MTDETTFSDALLVGLTPEQREAVMSPARRLLVRATAGSGKTHVLTLRIQRRIRQEEIAADQVLAMTFTRKAGDELRKRLFRAGIRDIRAGTFHRAALTLVNQYREDHHLKPVVLESNRRRLVSALAHQLRESGDLKLEDWQLPRLEQEIGWALSQGFNGALYAKNARKLRRDAPLAPAQFADVLDRYVGLCASRGVLDFDLLLSEAITLLRDEPNVLAAFRHRNRSFYVDETQDMNPLQFMLLRQMAGDDPDLFCVGDPNQSIYGFNGANPQLLNEIIRTWPDTAVLARTNAQLEMIARYLDAAGIPSERRGPEHSPASDLLVAHDAWSRRMEHDARDAVALSTIHRTKGLEFRHVAAIGWAEGQLPNYNATTPAELAEEQRLAYVALSRAEDSLLITWSRGRNDPRYPDRSPSRFLGAIESAIAAIDARNAPLTGEARRARLAAIRRELEATQPPVTLPDSARNGST